MTSSADLTLYTLTIADTNQRSYATSTIKGTIQKGGTNLNGLPLGNHAKWAWTLFTRAATSLGAPAGLIKEGDRVLDPTTNKLFEVLHVDPILILNSFTHYICELLQLQNLSVYKKDYETQSRDSTTGWLPRNYSVHNNVYINISPLAASRIRTPIGFYTKADRIAVTSATLTDPNRGGNYVYIREGDMIIDSDPASDSYNQVYEVTSVVPYPTQRDTDTLLSKIFTVLYLTRREMWLSPISGGWHVDSASVKTDPRDRMKTWLDTYLLQANLLITAGTNADYVVMFSNADYPLITEFRFLGIDIIFAVDKISATPLIGYDKKPYGFDEIVPIHIYAGTSNESYYTMTRLVESAENEVRRIATAYPFGSIRSIEAIKHEVEYLGEIQLFSTTVTIKYKRSNDDYIATTPTVSYGDDWIYEGDTLTEGDEGTWTLTQGAGSTTAQAINEDLNLVLTCTVHSTDSYTKNGTSIALSTSVYTKVRFRYKTSGNATAKIVAHFSDASTQTVLSETASATFTTATVTLTTAKTLQYFSLYRCDGTGTVEYDFVQVYKGEYTLPNLVRLNSDFQVNDALLDDNGQGEITQPAGTHLREVRMTLDLDVEHSSLTWKRPQTTTPKTDYNNTDTIYELAHYHGDTHLWHWLDLGSPTHQFKARLVEIHESTDGDQNTVELLWREYRHGGQETLTERFGLSL